ncbi:MULTISPECIES: hypothetical protein [Streptomyces]|uniref:FXSXX-COOH protein n=2 Tax=Streptomyces TaxID=1883 RepID=A0ABV9J8P5_9ACTN
MSRYTIAPDASARTGGDAHTMLRPEVPTRTAGRKQQCNRLDT